MRLWVWRHFRFELPDDWEMLQFSKDLSRGRCAFADRYQFRIEFDWKTVPGPPDFKRLLSDYRSNLEREGKLENARFETVVGWNGLMGRCGGGETSRFGRFFPEEGCLVEMVFIWPGNREPPVERPVLDSFARCGPDAGGGQRWRAFGVDIRAPAAWRLTDCRVEPALADLRFAAPKPPFCLRCRRLGMVNAWLTVPVARWLGTQVPDAVKSPAAAAAQVSGHHVDTVHGRFVPRGILKRKGEYGAVAWICPSDHRLYVVESVAAGEGEPSATRFPEAWQADRGPLACCAAMGESE